MSKFCGSWRMPTFYLKQYFGILPFFDMIDLDEEWSFFFYNSKVQYYVLHMVYYLKLYPHSTKQCVSSKTTVFTLFTTKPWNWRLFAETFRMVYPSRMHDAPRIASASCFLFFLLSLCSSSLVGSKCTTLCQGTGLGSKSIEKFDNFHWRDRK